MAEKLYMVEKGDRNELIRIYHRMLSHKLATFAIEGLDVVGFQRELGQLYITAIPSKKVSKEKKLLDHLTIVRSKILHCFQQLINAGVSIELVDGDTQNVNKEIILDLLETIK